MILVIFLADAGHFSAFSLGLILFITYNTVGKQTEMNTFGNMGWDELFAHLAKLNNKLRTSLFLLQSQFDGLRQAGQHPGALITEIISEFEKVRALFDRHLEAETEQFVPSVNRLCQMENTGLPVAAAELDKLMSGLAGFKKDHETLKNILIKIRQLANNYNSTQQSAPAEKLSIAYLFNFEQDFHLHSFIYEDIVWQRLRDMEVQLRRQIQD